MVKRLLCPYLHGSDGLVSPPTNPLSPWPVSYGATMIRIASSSQFAVKLWTGSVNTVLIGELQGDENLARWQPRPQLASVKAYLLYFGLMQTAWCRLDLQSMDASRSGISSATCIHCTHSEQAFQCWDWRSWTLHTSWQRRPLWSADMCFPDRSIAEYQFNVTISPINLIHIILFSVYSTNI